MIQHIENHIEKMRGKPDHIKKRYALGVSLGFTSIVFIFWLTSFNIGASGNSRVVAEAKSPMESMTASAADAYKYIKDAIFGANKTTYSSDNIEVVGGKN